MSRKLTRCKECGERISKSAKRCPHCGARQGGGIGKIIGTVILVFLILGLIGAIFGGDGDEPTRVNRDPADSTVSADSEDSAEPADSGDSAPASNPEPTNEPQQTTFGVGEAVSLNDIVVTLVDVSESNGKDFFKPQDGEVFILCEFEIENNSDNEVNISSMLSFNTYIDDYSTNIDLSAVSSSDKSQLDGSIAAGKKMNGIVGYAVDAGWSEIEIHFTPNFWKEKRLSLPLLNNDTFVRNHNKLLPRPARRREWVSRGASPSGARRAGAGPGAAPRRNPQRRRKSAADSARQAAPAVL